MRRRIGLSAQDTLRLSELSRWQLRNLSEIVRTRNVSARQDRSLKHKDLSWRPSVSIRLPNGCARSPVLLQIQPLPFAVEGSRIDP
jgi:hypothetical protein